MAVLDAGAEEVKDNGDSFEIHSEPTDLQAIRDALKEAGIEYETDEAEFVPSMQVPLDARRRQEVHEARGRPGGTRRRPERLQQRRPQRRSAWPTRGGLALQWPLRVLGVDPGLPVADSASSTSRTNRRATLWRSTVVGTLTG